jgi:rhodanese-related sulfurtransferase
MNTSANAGGEVIGAKAVFVRAARQAGLILLIALIPAAIAAVFHPRRPGWSREQAMIPEVEWTVVRQWREPVLWVDARSAAAYARGHVPGALSLLSGPGDEAMAALVAAWHPGTMLVVYCDSPRCDAAQSAAGRLRRELGIEEVYVLKGGWSAWVGAQTQKP